MEGKGKGMGILALLGGSKPSDDEDAMYGGADMALKAAFRAIKDDDFEGFKESMTEWYDSCSDKGMESDNDD